MFGDWPGYPNSTLADSTLIQIFVEIVEICCGNFFFPPKNKNFVKENEECIRIFHDIQFFNMESSYLIKLFDRHDLCWVVFEIAPTSPPTFYLGRSPGS